MNFSNLTLPVVAAVITTLISIVIIAPLVRIIPKRLFDGWRLELETLQEEIPSTETCSISRFEKITLAYAAGVMGFTLIYQLGFNQTAAAMTGYFLALILLVAINIKHQLLPDSIVLPVLWAGLLFHAASGDSNSFIWGAAIAYLVPYSFLFVVRLRTGKEVMGYGDLKCLAMAGAWFGVSSLPVLFGAFIGMLLLEAILTAILRRQNSLYPTGVAHFSASLIVAMTTGLV